MRFAKTVFWLGCLMMLLALRAQDSAPQDCWGKDKPCSDGTYRDYQGKEQPNTCNNYKTTPDGDVHKCACNKATECPDVDKDGKEQPRHAMPNCGTYCRESACKCISPCDD
jgi:hypothetical protein